MRLAAQLRLASILAAFCALTALAPARDASAQAPTPTAPPGYAIERILPSFQNVSLAQSSFSTDVTVEGVTNLGGYEVLLTFDSSVVSFVSATDGSFLGSTGRTTLCAPPVLEPLAGTQTKLHFGCGTVGSTPPTGPSGTGVLAHLVFAPLATQVAQLTLEPSLVDPLGDPINAVAYGGQVDIAPGPTQTPTHTPSPTMTPTPCPGGVCPTSTPIPCSPTIVRIDPPALTGNPNVALDVAVSVEHVCDVGAFEFTLNFDPAYLEFVTFDVEAFLGSTGRTVACPAAEIASSAITVRCATLGAPPPTGPSGSGPLATLRFVPMQLGNSALHLSGVTLLGPAANSIPSTVEDGSVNVVPCPLCPTVTPTQTPTTTPTIAATFTPTPTVTATPCSGLCPTPVIATATSPPSSGPVMVSVDPTVYSPVEGTTFTATVRIDDVGNLGAFSVLLAWNPGILSLSGATVGGFLGSTGRASFCSLEQGAPGTARFSCGTLGATPPGATGSGVLVAFDFTALVPGSSALSLAEVSLLTPAAHLIPVPVLVDGAVTVSSCSGACPTATPTVPGTPTSTPGSGSNAMVGATPQHVNVTVGASFTVDVGVTNVANLGAFEFLFQYATAPPSFISFSGNPGRIVPGFDWETGSLSAPDCRRAHGPFRLRDVRDKCGRPVRKWSPRYADVPGSGRRDDQSLRAFCRRPG